jgi:DNA-binding NtrC family response regulator
MKTIMVVDDETSVLEEVKKNLEPNEFEVITVDNSRKALELIEQDDKDKFSLILIDTNIPNSKAPALFSMKPQSKMNIDTSKEEDFLQKPFTREQLIEFIKKKI